MHRVSSPQRTGGGTRLHTTLLRAEDEEGLLAWGGKETDLSSREPLATTGRFNTINFFKN